MTFDVFGDFATRGYLRNVAGEKDLEIVKVLEHAEFRATVSTALADLAKSDVLTYADVLKTHRTLFQGVYPSWAGLDRATTAPDRAIGKGGRYDLFAHPADCERSCEYGLARGQDVGFMRKRPGEVMGILAHAHPFLDGNGRTIMCVHSDLARRANMHIDWTRTDKTAYLNALTEELLSPGKGHLDGYLHSFTKAGPAPESAARQLGSLAGLAGLAPKPSPPSPPGPAGIGGPRRRFR